MIAVAADLPHGARREAIEAGPPHAETVPGYPELMRAAGFASFELSDVTDEYLQTLRAWHATWKVEAGELARLVGEEELAERQSNRERAIRAVSRGLLERYLIWSTKD